MKIFNRNNAAKLLGISVQTLDRSRKTGKLLSRRIGSRIVIMEDDLFTFLDASITTSAGMASNADALETETKTGGGK